MTENLHSVIKHNEPIVAHSMSVLQAVYIKDTKTLAAQAVYQNGRGRYYVDEALLGPEPIESANGED